MKKLKSLLYLAIVVSAISCNKENVKVLEPKNEITSEHKRVENDLPTDGQGFQDFELQPLNIFKGQIFGRVYMEEEFDVMIQDITDVIMTDGSINGNNLTTLTFSGRVQLERIEENDIVMYAVSIVNDVVDSDLDDLDSKACPTQTKTCCSKGCVEDTIAEIYSADRDVEVSYVKGVCRTISYAYQDC
jgi:hypothetical protein